jgi:hypothetical protein
MTALFEVIFDGWLNVSKSKSRSCPGSMAAMRYRLAGDDQESGGFIARD